MNILHIIYIAKAITESTPNLTIQEIFKQNINSFVFSLRKPAGIKGDYPVFWLPIYKLIISFFLFFLCKPFFCLKYLLLRKTQNKFWIKENTIYLIQFSFLFSLIKKNNITHLNCFFGNAGEFLVQLKSLLPIKTIVSFHGLDTAEKSLSIYKNLKKYCDSYFVLSNSMKKDLISAGFNQKIINVVKTGLDFSNMPVNEQFPRKNQILYVGRLVEKKSITDAISAFKLICKKHPEFKLVVVGDGPLMARAVNNVEKFNLIDSVIFLGQQHPSNVYKLMLKSKLFFLPSKTASNGDKEGIPVTIIEAQALGLPVVSTYHAGIPEGVIENKTALLFNEGDVYTMSKGLERLITDKELWNRFSQNAKKYAIENYSIDIRVKKILEVFKRI